MIKAILLTLLVISVPFVAMNISTDIENVEPITMDYNDINIVQGSQDIDINIDSNFTKPQDENEVAFEPPEEEEDIEDNNTECFEENEKEDTSSSSVGGGGGSSSSGSDDTPEEDEEEIQEFNINLLAQREIDYIFNRQFDCGYVANNTDNNYINLLESSIALIGVQKYTDEYDENIEKYILRVYDYNLGYNYSIDTNGVYIDNNSNYNASIGTHLSLLRSHYNSTQDINFILDLVDETIIYVDEVNTLESNLEDMSYLWRGYLDFAYLLEEINDYRASEYFDKAYDIRIEIESNYYSNDKYHYYKFEDTNFNNKYDYALTFYPFIVGIKESNNRVNLFNDFNLRYDNWKSDKNMMSMLAVASKITDINFYLIYENIYDNYDYNNWSIIDSGYLLYSLSLYNENEDNWEYTNDSEYPWHYNVIATQFSIGAQGESDTTAWDCHAVEHYGGIDNRIDRNGWYPLEFIPNENPFYLALPYTDVSTHGANKENIYWYDVNEDLGDNYSFMKNRWVKIKRGSSTCYAQIEDSLTPTIVDENGEEYYDDPTYFDYVFGDTNAEPTYPGVDISPAVSDCLGMDAPDDPIWGHHDGEVSWRFIDINNVPQGPWREIVTTTDLNWDFCP